jgi:hypothetical protein
MGNVKTQYRCNIVSRELLQMRDKRNNSDIHKLSIWILYIGFFSMLTHAAKAECVPNQSEVPVCLSGTAVSPDYSGAVIQENGQPGLRQVLPGDIVDSWTVGEIGPRYVVLQRGTRTVRLELPDTPDTSSETASAPPPDEAPEKRPIKHGLKHPRSLARGGE